MIELIYLDMDGVLTNFNKRYIELFNIDPVSIKKPEFDARWKQFITDGHFMSLEWNPGAEELLEFVDNSGVPYEILSSTGGTDFFDLIYDQKNLWLGEHGITCPANIVPGRKHKTNFARPERLLIDDQEGIVVNFINAGGQAIHHTDILTTLSLLDMRFGL